MNHALLQALSFLSAGLVGMFAHYLKSWLKREIAGNLVDYLFRDHPRKTALAVMALAGATGTAALGGQLAGLTLEQLVMMAFTTGFACDSALNKGAQH